MMIQEGALYFMLSGFVAVCAVAAVVIAKKAMERGLTYSMFAATIWTLGVLAVARFWHTLYEITELDARYGKIPELIEYSLYIVAYIIFIWLVRKAKNVKV